MITFILLGVIVIQIIKKSIYFYVAAGLLIYIQAKYDDELDFEDIEALAIEARIIRYENFIKKAKKNKIVKKIAPKIKKFALKIKKIKSNKDK